MRIRENRRTNRDSSEDIKDARMMEQEERTEGETGRTEKI